MARNAAATSPSTTCLVSVGFLATPPRYGHAAPCASPSRWTRASPAGRTTPGDLEPAGRCAEPAPRPSLGGMTTTQSLPAQIAAAKNSAQYSLPKILGIWASVTVPMAVLAFVIPPAIMPHTSLYRGLVHWIAMVVGMMWQFVVSMAILRHELGRLRWAAVKERIWLNVPRDP